ncbi:MAG: glucosaminidase domain-containing protein [Bacteroidota bacterium]
MKTLDVILLAVFFCLATIVNAQNKFFNEYRPVADSLANQYQIPASVILAIASQESGDGSSAVARRLNNHFGLKGRVAGGDTVALKSSYKYFASASDSYVYFCNLIAKKKFYLMLKGNNDYKKWVVAIANTGYAGNAKVWSRHIIGIIQKYNLHNL